MAVAIITGTTGFVGSHFLRALRNEYSVVEVNRRKVEATGSGIVWDFSSLLPSGLPKRADLLVHCASPMPSQASDNVHQYLATNVTATSQLLSYADTAGVQKVVFLSSGAVYGRGPHAFAETDSIDPVNVYGCAKAAGEFTCRAHQSHVSTLCLRLFYPYGPGQKSPRLIPTLIARITAGQPIVLNSDDGGPRMNPLFIEDLISWTLRLVVMRTSGVFNLAGNEVVTVRHLAEQIASLVGRPANFDYRDSPSGDTVGSIESARSAAGFSPAWTIQRGLAETVA